MATRRCHYCETVLRDGNATRDHIVPKSKEGVDATWNIVWSCKKCNREKGSDMPTCECVKCKWALMQWELGIRRGAGAVIIKSAGMRAEPPLEPLAPDPPQSCLSACQRFGCAFPRRCYRLPSLEQASE